MCYAVVRLEDIEMEYSTNQSGSVHICGPCCARGNDDIHFVSEDEYTQLEVELKLPITPTERSELENLGAVLLLLIDDSDKIQ
jgi:hypothetical protein